MGLRLVKLKDVSIFFTRFFDKFSYSRAERTDIRSIKIASSTLNNHSKH